MSQYTEILHLKAETLSMEDDGYEESLLEVATLFRSFDEAFSLIIQCSPNRKFQTPAILQNT